MYVCVCSHVHKPSLCSWLLVCSVCGVVVPQEESVSADIGGDMNHVHRVHIQLSNSESISVIVKRAPEEVKVHSIYLLNSIYTYNIPRLPIFFVGTHIL